MDRIPMTDDEIARCEQHAADEEAELTYQRMLDDEYHDTREIPMRDPVTLGPLYRTTEATDVLDAWQADDKQWLFTDGTTYLVGYAPAIFRDAPIAQGFRITSPEELLRRLEA